jgi:flagellar hook-associated protein 3 FlgL
MSGLADLQRQLSSGTRISKPSDDPVGVGTVLQSSGQLRAITQYKRNLEGVRSRQSLEEDTLGQLTLVLERARELAVGQGSSNATTETRLVAQAEVDRLLEFAISLGNTQYQGTYLFGGEYADQIPFNGSTTPNPLAPPQGEMEVEIGPDQRMGMNHSGQEVFVDTGVFQALEDFTAALGADDPVAIGVALNDLVAAHGEVQQLIGDIGGRQNTLDMASQNLEALEINLESLRSSIQDTDMERAVSELVSRQNTFQAALAANAQILGQSLTDYLR